MKALLLNRVTTALSIIGMFIAGILSYGHYMHIVPPCSNEGGCEKVQTHPSSVWHLGSIELPVAYIGLASYIVLVALSIMRQRKGLAESRGLVNAGFGISAIGMAMSAYLTFYSITTIHATCQWCLGSAATMVLLFVTHALLAQMDYEPGLSSDAKKDFRFYGIAAVLFVLAFGYQSYSMTNGGKKITPLVKLDKLDLNEFVPADAHFHGRANADIVIIEFGDLVCPSCRATYAKTQEAVEKTGGNIKFIFRHMPMHKLQGHEAAFSAAVLAEIAGEQGKFFDFINGAYAIQEEPKDLEPFVELAKNMGINVDKLDDRIGDSEDKAFKRVYKDLQFANAVGMKGTPSFIVMIPGRERQAVTTEGLIELLSTDEVKKIAQGG